MQKGNEVARLKPDTREFQADAGPEPRSLENFELLQRGVMGFWKFSPFLALSILVLYQVGFLQAAPLRATLEICSYPATLSEKESRVLLAGLVKDYVLMKVHELGQETEGSRITAQRRVCNTATCVTHHLTVLMSKSGGTVKSNFVPPNMGFKAFGQHQRDLQA
ncbi:hypothetical protein MC885_017320 [Smutsia gigantea]|nr:hypothetical protein MC885_017320 [Smutsia gigantea]